MSSCIEVGASSSTEQLCYIPCNFCNIVLAVSVPCSSLYEIVTVRCGHCSNIWSVNMAAVAFQAFSSFHNQQQYAQAPNNMNSPEYRIDLGSSSVRCNNNKMAIRQPTMIPSEQRIVNPQRRSRGSKQTIQISATGKHSVQLQKIGHISLIFILDSCWRATTTNLNLMIRTLGSFERQGLHY